jgi:hypothetical protein
MRKVALVLLISLLFLMGCNVIPLPLGVVLATPSNGATVDPQYTVLTWVSVGNNTYEVQVSAEANFKNLAVNATNVTNLLYPVSPGTLNNGSTYFWRVRAFRGGETSQWTSAAYFLTSGGIPPTPPPVTPGTILAAAILDGSPWNGPLNYSISGPSGSSGYSVPYSHGNTSPGTYTVTYYSGGPAGASLSAISPAPTQVLSAGASIAFTFIFRSGSVSGSASISATLNGAPWSGPLNYTVTHYSINGPVEKTGYSVPGAVTSLPGGNVQLNYNSGGPEGATLSGITPSAQQTLGSGGMVSFTLNFSHQQAYGNIVVHATVDGAPWQTAPGSGGISYSIQGPRSGSGSTIPNSYTNHPAGSYIITYETGGPIGSTFAGVSPSPEQTLTANGTVIFTLNFRTQARGTVHVNATLNGQPWSGAVGYVLTGPYPESGGHVPYSHSNTPSGEYSVNYSSGGPPSSVFEGVSHSSQYLPAGGSVTFTLKFVFRGVLPGPLVQ